MISAPSNPLESAVVNNMNPITRGINELEGDCVSMDIAKNTKLTLQVTACRYITKPGWAITHTEQRSSDNPAASATKLLVTTGIKLSRVFAGPRGPVFDWAGYDSIHIDCVFIFYFLNWSGSDQERKHRGDAGYLCISYQFSQDIDETMILNDWITSVRIEHPLLYHY